MPALLAAGLTVGVALVVWLLQVLTYSRLGQRGQRVNATLNELSVFLTRIALVVTVAAVGIPCLVWACGKLMSAVDGNVAVGVGGSVGTVLLTFVTSLATLLWKKRKTITDAVGGSGDKATKRSVAVPNGLLQLLLVILSVAALAASWLFLVGLAASTTATALDNKADSNPGVRAAVGITVAVILVGGFVDETSLSLHPFYRRRLASAFAVRTLSPKGSSGEYVAVGYAPRERTPLSTYAVPAIRDSFPQFVFAAAANLTGEERTPPGLTAVSFTMGAGWVGGPDVGWVKTAAVEAVSPGRLRRDLTVQAAVAISGAAVASAMGRFARWYQIVLAVSGVRLGAWLPNPVYLGSLGDVGADGQPAVWTNPGLPRIRKASYLLREVFNIHPYEERLLQVTDGGHYENLGIVEALRRRCTTIYCIDGGGDSPPTAPGLAQAMALAESELGVTFELDQPFRSEPGSGTAIEPKAPLAALNASLSTVPVITGTFTYPAASGLDPTGEYPAARRGRLFVARALLWPEMPYPLLSYAAQNPVFPHDSTGDQWFGNDQFTAYTELGRALGKEVKRVRDSLPRGV
jgi:hypothetical protein